MNFTFSILDTVSIQSPQASANEDAVGFSRSAAWAIDGATGVTDTAPLTPGPTDAAWLAGNLNSKLRAAFDKPNADPLAVLAGLQADIEREFRGLHSAAEVRSSEQPTAALALAALAGPDLNFFGIGDCRILCEHRHGQVIEFNPSEMGPGEKLMLQERQRLLAMSPHEDPWPRLKPFIQSLRDRVNTPGGYSIVHPSRPWVFRLRHQTIAAKDVRHVLIVSDGLYRLVDPFGRFNPEGFLRAVLGGGLPPLCQELRSIEKADASSTRFPRVKATDDASAILARIVAT